MEIPANPADIEFIGWPEPTAGASEDVWHPLFVSLWGEKLEASISTRWTAGRNARFGFSRRFAPVLSDCCPGDPLGRGLDLEFERASRTEMLLAAIL